MSMPVELLLFILATVAILCRYLRRPPRPPVSLNAPRKRPPPSPQLRAFTPGIRTPRIKDRKRRLPALPQTRPPPKGAIITTGGSVWSECHPDVLAYLQRLLMQDLSTGPKTLQNCRLVNRHWYSQLCSSMQELSPRLRVFTFWDLDALRRFQNLKKLTLRDDSIVSDAWLHELPKVVPQLEALALRVLSDSSKKSAIGRGGVQSIMQLEHLKHLEVAACGFNSTEAIEKLSTKASLTYLDLSENGLHYPCIQELSCLTNLESLILGGNPALGDPSLKLMTGFTKLRHLGFRGSRWVSDLGIAHLSSMTSLTALDLRMCDGMTGSGFASCKGLPLTRLDLMCCSSLTDGSLEHFAVFKFLKFLDVRMCPKITDEGLLNLKSLPSLVDLRLGSCTPYITNLGLESLCHLPCLERLTLFFLQEITYQGLEMVCGSETLKKLTIVQCRSIVPSSVERLIKGHPMIAVDVFPYTGPDRLV